MNVHLTPDLEEIVNKKIAAGVFSSPAEVVGEALRLMHEQDEVVAGREEEIRAEIAKGYASLERGEGIDADEAFRQLDERHQRYRASR
jgi:antitoxin ParD1/3/4